ncbi:MAG: 3-deoxy-8-phosphooctulonate synthase [Planctomycetota bacterium]|nr:3-deoxy-8-phosphooctulonate synthase [Planctomycetota bacterium]
MSRTCRIGDVEIGPGKPLAIIAGPCVLESVELAVKVGQTLRDTCRDLGLAFVFKASFDKANRTSIGSPRGPGLETGLKQLAQVADTLGVPITTDIHTPQQCEPVAEVVDLLQVPAFLCRQTDLLLAAGAAAAKHRRAVNVKKGQFLSPEEMQGPVNKLAEAGCTNTMLTERGTFFGYHRLVNDFLGLGDLMELDAEGGSPPVCFDATHSTQLPGSGSQTGGRPERAPLLAKAATAAGVHALFIECHPDPASAASDGATQQPLDSVPALLRQVAAIRNAPDAGRTP